MSSIRRIFMIVLFFAIVGGVIYGYSLLSSEDPETLKIGHKFIGFGIASGFFILMPVFIYHRWKDKNVKDYMLTEENIMKMKAFNDSKNS